MIADRGKQGRFKDTAEALRAQRKPNEDKLTRKNRNKFDAMIKRLFYYYNLSVLCAFAVNISLHFLI